MEFLFIFPFVVGFLFVFPFVVGEVGPALFEAGGFLEIDQGGFV